MPDENAHSAYETPPPPPPHRRITEAQVRYLLQPRPVRCPECRRTDCADYACLTADD